MSWAHENIAKFFKNIIEHNYILIFVTSRPISHSEGTIDYLNSIDQNGEKIPECPVMTRCSGLFEALNSEIIQNNPWEFKYKTLEEIKSVFGYLENCLYAGIGNRDTDTKAY